MSCLSSILGKLIHASRSIYFQRLSVEFPLSAFMWLWNAARVFVWVTERGSEREREGGSEMGVKWKWIRWLEDMWSGGGQCLAVLVRPLCVWQVKSISHISLRCEQVSAHLLRPWQSIACLKGGTLPWRRGK